MASTKHSVVSEKANIAVFGLVDSRKANNYIMLELSESQVYINK